MISRTVLAGVAALAACAAVLWVVGCHRAATEGGAIDVPALERQLERVIRLQLTAAGFYERTVEVTCLGEGEEGLRFRCHVDATNPTLPTQSWQEEVTCSPADTGVPRCSTEDGDALQ
jgi:hypothetical protein